MLESSSVSMSDAEPLSPSSALRRTLERGGDRLLFDVERVWRGRFMPKLGELGETDEAAAGAASRSSSASTTWCDCGHRSEGLKWIGVCGSATRPAAVGVVPSISSTAGEDDDVGKRQASIVARRASVFVRRTGVNPGESW